MNAALLILFALWLPWNPQGLGSATEAIAWCHYAPPAGYPERIGWYSGDIHVVHCRLNAETKRRYVHELDHYLTHHYGVSNWDQFVSVVRLESAAWNKHQRDSIEGMVAYGGGFELHAELPLMLHGKIPATLQPWYPWLDLK